jgi:hypothetical protein
MADLEQRLRTIGAEVDWPTTPVMRLRLAPRRARERLPVRPVWVALAVIVLAVVVASSVPAARSAVLRFFHLGGVSVERVRRLPAAPERRLDADLGPIAGPGDVQTALGEPMRLPPGSGAPPIRLRGSIASVVLNTPDPTLLSELLSDELLLKKIAGTSTHVTWLEVGGSPGIWIAGVHHVVVFPDAPPRLAGNVLVWARDGITYRLEGRALRLPTALRIARSIPGT